MTPSQKHHTAGNPGQGAGSQPPISGGPLQCPAPFRGHCQGKSLLDLSDVELSDLIKASPLSFCPSDKRTGQAHPCKHSPCSSNSNQTISHNHSSSAASLHSPAERRTGAAAPSHTHKVLTVTRKALTVTPSSFPVLTPQLEPGGLAHPCPPHRAQPSLAQCGAQTVPFSTFLAPNSLLPPSFAVRGYFSPDPGQLQNQGYRSTSLAVASPSLQRSFKCIPVHTQDDPVSFWKHQGLEKG